MFYAALCEHRMELASRQRSEKLDDTQRKLDLFYTNMELVRKHQSLGGVAEGAGLGGHPRVRGDEEEVGVEGGRKERMKKKERAESVRERGMELADATPILDPDLEDSMELDPEKGLELELELDQVLARMESTGIDATQPNASASPSNEVKPTRSNFRLVLKPLPPDHQDIDTSFRPLPPRGRGGVGQGCVLHHDQCPHDVMLMFQCPQLSDLHSCRHGEEATEDSTCDAKTDQTGSHKTGSDVTGSASTGSDADEFADELTMFDHIEHELTPQITSPDGAREIQAPTPHKEYPRSYHTLQFLPYNPLPDQLEALIFPWRPRNAPLPLYNDPYWPRKQECLELVGELKEDPKLSSFTGTFINPEARGVR